MIVSLNWLLDYVDIEINSKKDVDDLCQNLINIGLEVDSVRFQSDKLENIVVAEIAEKNPHPNADKLSLCKVITDSETFDVVCGATNHKKGDKVVFAKVGAWVYVDEPDKKFQLKKTKIRGEESCGMLCSFEELCLPGDSSGIIILPKDSCLGKSPSKLLNLDDVIIDLDITTNRGDCLSHLGIARELAAVYRKKVKYPKWIVKERENEKSIYDSVEISQVDHSVCPRYMARLVRNVKIAPSPPWLSEKLKSVGIRPINNLVDITNFVLFEYGQPLHAFDFAEIKNKKNALKKEIIVRKAFSEEKFTTLDETQRSLTNEDILICDGERAIALGGVMGGINSEISDKTKDVLIESAIFEPVSIRKTAKRLNLQTDSSGRFEKKVDPYATHIALDRAAELISQIAGGKVAPGFLDKCSIDPYVRKEIRVDFNFVNSFLGTDIEPGKMKEILESLGFNSLIHENYLIAKVPSWRNDVNFSSDLIEEIARIYGFNNIQSKLPGFSEKFFIKDSPFKRLEKLKDEMLSLGFSEVVNYAFYGKSFENKTCSQTTLNGETVFPVEISNPLTSDFHVLRRSILSGLLKSAIYNINRGNKDLKIFEIGSVFASIREERPSFNDIVEKKKLAALILGDDICVKADNLNYSLEKREFDYYDIKAPLDKILKNLGATHKKMEKNSFFHPGYSSDIYLGDKYAGFIAKLGPEIISDLEILKNCFVFEIDLEILFQYNKDLVNYKAPSKYPIVSRDLALIVDKNVTSQDLIKAIEDMKIRVIDSVKVFDVFLGKNLKESQKSVALNIVYQSYDKTLADKEIQKIEKRVLANLFDLFQAALRPS